MLTDKDLQDITRAAAGGHLASAATVLELVDEITRRRQAFAETETVPLEALVPSLTEFVAGMRAEIALKIAPLRPASGTHHAAEAWTSAIDEAARGAAHHLLNTCEVARPPCQHDEFLYVCELTRLRSRITELETAAAAVEGVTAEIVDDVWSHLIGNPTSEDRRRIARKIGALVAARMRVGP